MKNYYIHDKVKFNTVEDAIKDALYKNQFEVRCLITI